jgi:dTMP kinase
MFLVFEGLDGSGKSSLIKRLVDYLTNQKIDFIVSREPGGTPLGEQLRALILAPQAETEFAPCERAELLMYEASRAQHVARIILPALRANKWVLCDRFTASSIAFQSGGRNISAEDVEWLNRFAINQVEPSLNILLDLSVEASKNRRLIRQRENSEVEDRIESEAEAFHQRVRESFLQQSRIQPEKWLVLDATLSPEQIFNTLLLYLKDKQWVE